MERKYVLAAALLAVLGVSQSHAEEKKEVTMKEYTDHLLAVYGETGVIIAGTINGKDKDGNFKEDFFPGPNDTETFYMAPIKPLSYTLSEPQCDASQVIIRVTSGAYAFPWCAKYQVIGGVPYDAKRDTLYYANGRWTYVNSVRFDCQNSSDLAQMPATVQVAVCH